MLDDRYQPADITVPARTTVTWVNKGNRWHSVASIEARFVSGRVELGESFSYHFDTPGPFTVYCQHHSTPGMNGTITVTWRGESCRHVSNLAVADLSGFVC